MYIENRIVTQNLAPAGKFKIDTNAYRLCCPKIDTIAYRDDAQKQP